MSKLKNDYICGTCGHYNSDNCYCPLYGEKYEEDSCKDDWVEDIDLEAQKVDAAERETHRKEVEGEDLV